jgi:hypothetical protein
MNARVLASFALLLGAVSGRAQDAQRASTYDYDFAWDIAPRLVQAGCATAECHGGATGRGGFKLSLFGTDPRADYAAIVEELDGRRIDRLDPARSLILRKPTRELEHGGGLRWEEGDPSVTVLRDWIAAGAPFRGGEPFVPVRIELRWTEHEIIGFALEVRAFDAQGRERWATDRATYQSSHPEAIHVTRNGGLRVEADFYSRSAWIFARLGQLDAGLVWGGSTDPEPGQRAEDHTLARRLCFDLCRRWPTATELNRFFALPAAERVDAFAREWMASAEFEARFARFLDAWFANDDRGAGMRSGTARTLDALAREALADGARSTLLRRRSDPRDRAEHFAGAFLGLRLECARCHNHPADSWKQSDHLAFSALFVEPRPDGSAGLFFDPASGERIAPRFLGASADAGADALDPEALAEWILSEQRERFATNAANRLAAFLLGRGLVMPLDDHRTTNPPRDEALLGELRTRLIDARFDPRPVLHWLACTPHYQRASAPSADAEAEEHALRRARVLTTSELLHAVARALDAPLPAESPAESPLASELGLLAGDSIDELLQAPGNMLEVLAEFGGSDDDVLDELYLALLTRRPKAEERSLFAPRFASGEPRIAVLRGIARALILSREIGAHR